MNLDSQRNFDTDNIVKKWNPILEHKELPQIQDNYRRTVTAILLENQEREMLKEAPTVSTSGNGGSSAFTYNSSGPLAGYDPILISLVRRSMPNLMAYDICGVQPMTGPTGLIFAMKSRYAGVSGSPEALYNEADTRWAGTFGKTLGTATTTGLNADGNLGDPLLANNYAAGAADSYAPGFGMSRSDSENLGSSTATNFNEMAFSIDRTSVEAKTRALKAEFSTEFAQDFKAVHGLDAETELANILSTEILAEINREIIRTIYVNAKLGAQQLDLAGRAPGLGVTAGLGGQTAFVGGITGGVGGVYDLLADSDGRWSAERFRGLLYQIEREANTIAKETRRGKGNIIICSADVASALAMSGFLQISPALNTNLNVDDTGNTFAGTLHGRFKVYIDPYAGGGISASAKDYLCVGYKGTSPYDAGMFYCPYIPLQMMRAVGENSFQPKIGFKTRYGLVNNPFVTVADPTSQSARRTNQYYRIFRVDNLHGLRASV
jgi:hypothetical protein